MVSGLSRPDERLATYFFPSWACRCTSWSPSTAWWKSNTAGERTDGGSRPLPLRLAHAGPPWRVLQLTSGLRSPLTHM